MWGLFLTQGCEVYGGYMLLTWLPNYLQSAKGLSVLNAGMLTAVPFGAATVVAVALGFLSDRLLSRDAVHAGRRRTMLAVMLVSAASILLIPFVDDLWLIVLILAVARSMGAAGSALNFALVTDLVRNPADIGKVTSITGTRRQFVWRDGADRHRLRGRADRQFQRHIRGGGHPCVDWRRGDVDDDTPADRGLRYVDASRGPDGIAHYRRGPRRNSSAALLDPA